MGVWGSGNLKKSAVSTRRIIEASKCCRDNVMLTGVKSRSESASLADVAASMRSSQRLPMAEAGSAEKAFRPSILNLRAYSFDIPLSCFGRLLAFVMEDFRGLVGLSRFWIGGSVEDRPGGERDIIDGKSSLGLGEWKCGGCSSFMWLCIGGSSTEECIRGRRRASFSDIGSCSTN